MKYSIDLKAFIGNGPKFSKGILRECGESRSVSPHARIKSDSKAVLIAEYTGTLPQCVAGGLRLRHEISKLLQLQGFKDTCC